MDKIMEDQSTLLDGYLQELVSGEESLESLLARDPEKTEALRPELEAGLWLGERREVFEPRPGFVEETRERLLAQIRAQGTQQQPGPWETWRSVVAGLPLAAALALAPVCGWQRWPSPSRRAAAAGWWPVTRRPRLTAAARRRQ